MTYQVVLKDDAKSDIATLSMYLQNQFGDSIRQKQVSILISKMKSLSLMPNQGVNIFKANDIDFRLLRNSHNTILYEVNSESKQVVVLRIYDNKSDFMNRLSKIFDF